MAQRTVVVDDNAGVLKSVARLLARHEIDSRTFALAEAKLWLSRRGRNRNTRGHQVCSGCAPCKGGAFQWVQTPPGNRSSWKQSEAVMEVTKWLKPSISVSRIGDGASVQAATRVNAEQFSKRTMRRSTRQPYRGRVWMK